MAYEPGPAHGARIEKDGDTWTLVVERLLAHPPERVWEAITDPEHLAAWAPFDADRSLAAPGPVMLSTTGTPQAAECIVQRAIAPTLLEYNWGAQNLRWELERLETGTRLTLWHHIDRRYIAMGAAGWHLCFDVLDHLLRGTPVGRHVGPEMMKFPGWQRLHAEYTAQFGLSAAS